MAVNPFEDVKDIDAEYMERWLGGLKVNSLSPKVLYDIQQLVRHYADIIVPNKKVNISYSTDETVTPCASVENHEVKIPTSLLSQGRVDETIGAMIHELHHIKMSDDESSIWFSCFNFVCKVLDTLFIQDKDGEYSSIYALVMGDCEMSFDDIMSPDPQNPNAVFLRKACDDVAFFLNAIEDIRIDANTPQNLKKYIDKIDSNAFESFKPKYESGELDNDDLFNIIYKLLFHHKGYIDDDFISLKSQTHTTEDIINSTAKQNYASVFKTFSEELRLHIENLYSQNDKSSPSQPKKGEGRDIMDMYLSENSKENLKDLINGNAPKDKNDLADAVDFEDREFSPTSSTVDPLNLAEKIDSSKAKQPIISQEFDMEIKSYENITIHNTTENLTSYNNQKQKVDYSCIFYDIS